MIENRRAVLRPGIVALAVARGRIVNDEEYGQNIAKAEHVGVETDLHHFGVSALAAAHVRISGVLQMPAHVARCNRLHPLQAVEYRFQAPEAAASQGRNFTFVLWLCHIARLSRSMQSIQFSQEREESEGKDLIPP